jgi:hypothetical protein
VLIVWLYNNTGKSVFGAALYHAISNGCTILFHSYYDPRITGLIRRIHGRDRHSAVETTASIELDAPRSSPNSPVKG